MLLANLMLALAWTALQGALTLPNLLVGYGLGYLVLQLLRRGGVLPAHYVGKLGTALELFGHLIYELILANVRLSVDVMHPTHRLRPAVVRVPLDVSSDGEILMLAALLNLTPGSIALDLSEDRKTMYLHMMHAESTEQIRHEVKNGFERRVIRLFASGREVATHE